MYCPAHFAQTDTAALHALLRARPLATLVTLGEHGPNADHIPLLLDTTGGGAPVLRGHVARANPMWKTLPAGSEALAIFHGPDAYITPAWYPAKREHGKVVPTWNYAVVHARGPLRIVHDTDWLRAQLAALTGQQEAPLADPWAMTDAPAEYIEAMLAAVVGIELTVTALEGKWKASQNQPEGNRAGVIAGLRERGETAAAALVEGR